MHSPLLSGGKFAKEGKCTFVFGRKNAHVIKGRKGELVKEMMKQTKEENSSDIVMTVPFDEKTLTWKTNSTGQAKPLFNIASKQCTSNPIKSGTVRLSTSSSRLSNEENMVTSNQGRIFHQLAGINIYISIEIPTRNKQRNSSRTSTSSKTRNQKH